MASKFWLAGTACLLCDVCGKKYDKHFNLAIGPVLFAAILTLTTGFEQNIGGLPESDIGYQIIAFSMVIWPGLLLGMTLLPLLSAAEDKAACLWLMISPLAVTILGLPILAKVLGRGPQHNWRLAIGLSWAGILAGHFLSKSSLGRVVNDHISLGLLTAFPTFLATTGAVIMFFSVARMVQSHLRAANDLESTNKIPTAVIPFGFPPLWGARGSLCTIAWTMGLALYVSTINGSRARATLVSTNVAIVLTMAFLPPFSCKIWGRLYGDYMRLLFSLHVFAVLAHHLYYTFIASSGSVPGFESNNEAYAR